MKKNTLTLKKSTPSTPSTQTPPLEESRISKANRADKYLTENYPVWADCLPLSIGIKETIMLNYKKKYSVKSIQLLIKNHAFQPQYLQNIVDRKHRVNLKGKITHSITDRDKKDATKKLKYLLSKQ